MICRPFFGDQRLKERAEEVVLEIGITNGVFPEEGFEKCWSQVLVHNDGRKMKGNAKDLQEQAQVGLLEKTNK